MAETSLPTTDDRAAIYSACLDNEGAIALVKRLYGWTVDHIKQLPGYEDLNYLIKCSGVAVGGPDQYVLKVVNSRDAGIKGLMYAQADVMLHLRESGIVCSKPVKNLQGEYCGWVEIVDKTGKQPPGLQFGVCVYEFVPGSTVRDLDQPNTPMPDKWFYAMGQSLGTINKALLDFQKPSVSVLRDKAKEHIWSPDCVPLVRNIIWAVKDKEKYKLVESVLEEFETNVVPKMTELRQCVLHSDYNDMNIINLRDGPSPSDASWHTAGGLDIPADQDSQLGALGIIDFSDVVYSNLVFEPGNSQAYMMMSQLWGDPLVSGGHFLAGFNSVSPLTSTEMSLLRCCTAARLVQTLVNGLHAYHLDPTNKYTLDTQRTGWTVLQRLWNTPNGELMGMWERIAELYSK